MNHLFQQFRLEGWHVKPPIVIIASPRAGIYRKSIKQLQDKLKTPKRVIKQYMKKIAKIASQYLTSIITNKRKIENKQPTNITK